MTLAWHLLIVFAALLGAQELFRRTGPWFAWCVFLVLPALLTPHWFRMNPGIGIFPWAKLYTIALSVSWFTALRFTRLGELRWARAAGVMILAVNICEAMSQDMAGRHAAHYLVVASGLLLLVQLPDPRSAPVVQQQFGRPEYLYRGLTRIWVVEYSLWNWAFVNLNYPQIAGHHLAVLGAALVVGLRDPRRWLQARGYSLGTDLVLLATFPKQILPWTDTSHWSRPWRENLVATACLALAASAAGRYWASRRRRGGVAR